MALFAFLEKLNINPEEIKALSESAIIRIEKQLKAEARINTNFSVNEIEDILHLLRNRRRELELIYSNQFKVLRAIIERPNRFLIVYDNVAIEENEEIEKLRLFLDDYFGKELALYADNCLKKGYYNALYALLLFKTVLPGSLLDEIQNKLSFKITYAIECMSISTSNLEEKIDYCTNPFFFRVLGSIGAARFQSEVSSLNNTAIEKMGAADLKWQVFFAIGAFSAHSDSLKNTIAHNLKLAQEKGVEEVPINPRTKLKTGGTRIKEGGAFGITTKRTGIYILITILLLILFGIGKCDPGYDEDDFDMDTFQWEEIGSYDELVEDEMGPYGQPDLNDENGYIKYSPRHYSKRSFEDIIVDLHTDTVTFTFNKPIEFTTELTRLNGYNEFKRKDDNVTLINKTGRKAIFEIHSPHWIRYEALMPDSAVRVGHEVNGIRLYNGDNPELIEFRRDQELITHFRFAEVYDFDVELVKQKFDIDHDFDTSKAYSVKVKVRDAAIVTTITEKEE